MARRNACRNQRKGLKNPILPNRLRDPGKAETEIVPIRDLKAPNGVPPTEVGGFLRRRINKSTYETLISAFFYWRAQRDSNTRPADS